MIMNNVIGKSKKYKISQNDCFWNMLCRTENGCSKKLNEDDIQNKRGVYIFFDWNDKPLRIGKAVKLRNRIISYYSNPQNYYIFEKFHQQISFVSVIYTKSEKESVMLELDLLEKQKPKYNIHCVNNF